MAENSFGIDRSRKEQRRFEANLRAEERAKRDDRQQMKELIRRGALVCKEYKRLETKVKQAKV